MGCLAFAEKLIDFFFQTLQVLERRQIHLRDETLNLFGDKLLGVLAGLLGGVHNVLEKLRAFFLLDLPAMDALVDHFLGLFACHAQGPESGEHQLGETFHKKCSLLNPERCTSIVMHIRQYGKMRHYFLLSYDRDGQTV